MVSRPAPRPNEEGTFDPNGAAAKAGLNRSIHDAGRGQLLRFITYKAEDAGRVLIAVDPRNTSRKCSQCGHCEKANQLSQAVFRCLVSGHQAHADENAAINILRAGLALRLRPQAVQREAEGVAALSDRAINALAGPYPADDSAGDQASHRRRRRTGWVSRWPVVACWTVASLP